MNGGVPNGGHDDNNADASRIGLCHGWGAHRPRSQRNGIATLLIGAGQVVWILFEVLYLPELSWLQFVYGAVGIALLALPMLTSVQGYLSRPVTQRS